ncbi:MAG: transglycosylase domain-containing protein [Alloprevotella sp.]
MRRKFFIIAWSVLAFLLLLGVFVTFCINRGWIGYMPPIAELQNPISRYASQIISADGRLMGTWSRNENRVFVDYDSISPYLFDALVATEDVRFFEHSGIDVRALGRAVVKRGLLGHKEAGGGSTITQQLAKQLYSEGAESTMQRLMQKPIEWVIAVELEKNYTKNEILTLYLNYFDFLHNAVGIKTAANVYFSKSPAKLTLAESATLIGMCKNPSYYNPVREPERCRERRNVVLAQMVKAGTLSQEDYETVSAQPLELRFHRIDHKEGQGTYMREYLRRILMASKPNPKDYRDWQRQQYYEDSLMWETDPLYGWCKKNHKKDGSDYDIYTDGLKVYTTLDSRMQRYAEEAVQRQVGRKLQPLFESERRSNPNFPYHVSIKSETVKRRLDKAMRQSDRYRLLTAEGATEEDIKRSFNTPTEMTVYSLHGSVDTVMTPLDSIRYYKKFLRSSLVSMDPATGYVKAYVGGLNYAYFQYDMAMVGRRQIGSTMKPFVYAMGLQGGMTPETTILNEQRSYGGWCPRNGSRARYGSMVTLKWGLSQSNNWVTAGLMYEIDPTGQGLVRDLHALGVANDNLQPSLPLCLGTCDITAGELASAYTAFVQKGIRRAPILVTKIEDSEGNVLAEFTPRTNEVYSEETAYNMIDMMKAVIDHGTGRRLRYAFQMKGPIAGKTGTTNDNSDGWFVGCVPKLVTVVWVGGEERDIHFSSTASGQGSATALPVWALYMMKVYQDKSLGYDPEEDFEKPESMKRQYVEGEGDGEGGEEGSEGEGSDLMNGDAGGEATRSSAGESYFE